MVRACYESYTKEDIEERLIFSIENCRKEKEHSIIGEWNFITELPIHIQDKIETEITPRTGRLKPTK